MANVSLKTACIAAGVVTAWDAAPAAAQFVPPGDPITIRFQGSVTPTTALKNVWFFYTSNASFPRNSYTQIGDIPAGTATPFTADASARDEFLSLGRDGHYTLIGAYETGNTSDPYGVVVAMTHAAATAHQGVKMWADLFPEHYTEDEVERTLLGLPYPRDPEANPEDEPTPPPDPNQAGDDLINLFEQSVRDG